MRQILKMNLTVVTEQLDLFWTKQNPHTSKKAAVGQSWSENAIHIHAEAFHLVLVLNPCRIGYKQMFLLLYLSIPYLYPPVDAGLRWKWSPSSVVIVREAGTPWTHHQLITGEDRDTQSCTIINTSHLRGI